MNRSGGKKMRLLLVDDEEDIREVLKISLVDAGYQVVTAENGEQGLRVFREKHPDIVLTDIKMPGMDGIELLRHVKQENPETEVVMITGHGDMDLSIKSIKHGAVDFITKPIHVDLLEIALKRVCDKIRAKQKLTEYTETLESLVREKIELQSRLSALGLMLGSISHSVKGLLTNMDGGIYLLQSGMKKNNPQSMETGLDQACKTFERIKKMILDILFYAKERKIRKDPVSTLCFSKDLSGMMEPKISGLGIGFEIQTAGAPETLYMDEEFMRSALVNILDNAVDACREDKSKDSHKILLSIRKEDHHLVIDIQDDGIGMDLKTKEKIFNLFFSSKGTEGTGFGLYISNSIVRQHGGTISVTSVRGKGSLFSIALPL